MATKKNITISDIANHANVSKSTVSRVLNDTTPVNESKRAAVMAAMEEMQFEPNFFARGLASGQSMTIGVLTQKIGSPFYDAISQGIVIGLESTIYSPIFADGQWKPKVGQAAIEMLIGRKVDGVIIMGSSMPDESLDQVKNRLPTIIVGREVRDWGNQCLFVDNVRAAYEATQHLIELGHREIAHITGISHHQDTKRRLKGYRKALTDAGIDVDEELIIEGHFDGESGEAAVNLLLQRRKKFTAIFAANDMSAFGARLALYRKGIGVPEDVSLVSFDDQVGASFMTPPLTTIRQPAEELGIAASAALIKLINKEEFTLPKLETELIVRESTQHRE